MLCHTSCHFIRYNELSEQFAFHRFAKPEAADQKQSVIAALDIVASAVGSYTSSKSSNSVSLS